MKKLVLWLIVGLMVGLPILVRAGDTRLSSTSPYAQCFTANVISGSTCYTTDAATTVSGTTFTDIKLIDGTNPRMPGLWGRLAGTTSVDVETIDGTSYVFALPTGTYFGDTKLIDGTNPRMPGLFGRLAGTTSVDVETIDGTSFVNALPIGTYFNDVKLIDGTNPRMPELFGKLAGTTSVSVTATAGTSYTNALPIGTYFNDVKLIDGTNPRMPDLFGKLAGTTSVSVTATTGTSYTNSTLIGGTAFIGGITGTSYTNSTLIGGTSFIGGITGTNYSNVIPNAIVTQGVGSKTVSTSGTSLRLSAQAARMVVIKANAANTNSVYIVPGGTTSTDYSSTTNPGGIELAAKESITLPLISNVQEIVIDSTTNGEGINYTWIGY